MSSPRYDAFISYAHAADGRLAPALRQGLQDFARPWYRRRAMRVFLDQSSLAVNPALWATIAAALERSQVLVLLACPASAASPWVDRELEWWLEHRPAERVLLVLTGGQIAWDDARADFDWNLTDALPPRLAGRFREEPLHLDLRWAPDAPALAGREPRLQEAVAQLAASIGGRDKDELIGEDLRRHRQTLRTAWGAAAVLACTTLAALVAAQLFLQQRDLARAREIEARRHLYTAQLKQAQIAAANGDMLQVEHLLAGQIPQPGDADLRGFAWSVLWRASHREVLRLDGVAQARLAFAPDGQRLWLAGAAPEGDGGVLRDYALPSGKLRHEHALPFRPAALAGPVGGGDLRVAPALVGPQILGGAPLLRVPQDGSAPTPEAQRPGIYSALATSSDGQQRASARLLPQATLASELELQSGPDAAALRVPIEGWVRGLAYAPDGRELALLADDAGQTGRPARLLLIDAQSGHARLEQALDSPVAFALAWSLDGARVLVGDDRGSLQARSREDGRPLAGWAAHAGSVTALDLSADGRTLASGGVDRVTRLWDLDSGRALAALPLMRGPIDALAFAPDGAHLAAAGGLELKLWDVAALRDAAAAAWRRVPGPRLAGLAYSPDGRRLAALSGDGHITILAADSLQEHSRLQLDPDSLGATALAYAPSGRWLAAGGDGRLRVWSLATGQPVLERQIEVRDLRFAVDDELLVATERGVLAFDPAGGGERRLSRLRTEVLAYSPARQQFAAARSSSGPRDSRIRIWDARRGRELCQLEGDGQGLLALAFSPDGELLASGGYGGEVRLWRTRECRLLLALPPRGSTIQDLQFSPDGHTLAVSTGAAGASRGGVVLLLDPTSGDEQMSLPTGTAWARELAFSPDGMALAVGGDEQSLSGEATLGVLRGARPDGGGSARAAGTTQLADR